MFWKILKVVGYIIAGVFTVNLLYALFIYNTGHEDWTLIYNPGLGSGTAWQIIYSIILLLIAWGLISLSKKKLRSIKQKDSPVSRG